MGRGLLSFRFVGLYFICLLNRPGSRSYLDFCRVAHRYLSWLSCFSTSWREGSRRDILKFEAGPKGRLQSISQTAEVCRCLCICEKQTVLTSCTRLLCQLSSDSTGLFACCLLLDFYCLQFLLSKQWVILCIAKAICTAGLKNY